jgi:DNA-binding NarL/FixJ family response regulator
MHAATTVLVADGQPIYRRGIVACLAALPTVEEVLEATSVADARESAAAADVVLLDHELPGAGELVRELRDAGGPAVIVCLEGRGGMLDAFRAGAVGFLRRETLTPGTLAMAIEATETGTVVIAPELLGEVIEQAAGAAPASPADRSPARLTPREQHVLSLVAEGLPTREVSERLCYSERTVKNVLHDAVTKLGARSRSEAVAHAVRDGLI